MPLRPLTLRDLPLIMLPPLCIAATALFTKSFWGDEMLSMQVASLAGRELRTALSQDYHPPLYFLLLRGWMSLFGDGEAGLRTFQALQGVWMIGASLALFRLVFPERRYHPLFLLLILSVPLWLFLPMLRYYTLAASLAATSTVLLLRWLSRPTRWTATALAGAYLCLLYTDYPSSCIILTHLLYVCWTHRPVVRRLLLLLGVCGALFAPWAFVAVSQMRLLAAGTQTAALNAGPSAILLKVVYSAYGFLVGETVYPVEPAGLAAILALVGAAALFLAGKGWRGLRPVEVLLPLTAMLGILFTSVITTFLSRHTSFIYTPPRTFYALPFIFLTLGFVHDRLRRPAFRRGLLLVFATVSLYGLFNLTANRHFFMPVYASPWKAIVAQVEGTPGLILSDESICYAYYARRAGASQPELFRPTGAASLIEKLESREGDSGPATVFLVLSERESTASEIPQEVIVHLHALGRQSEHRTFLPYDATYRFIKTSLLGRPPGEAKFHLYRFEMEPD